MIYNTSIPSEKLKGELYWKRLSSNGKVVVILNKKEKTPNQNAYLYALLSMVAIQFGDRLEKTKQYIKQQCPFMHSKEDGFIYLVSIADLDARGINEFITWLRNWSVQTHGLYLMAADEYKSRINEVEKQIRAYRSYL